MDTINEDEKGPELLNSEIRTAIQEMKTKKLEGADGILAEFWKALGERAEKSLYSCVRISIRGEYGQQTSQSRS